jgi:hypothetical protein
MPGGEAVHVYVSEADNALYVRNGFSDAGAVGFHLQSTAPELGSKGLTRLSCGFEDPEAGHQFLPIVDGSCDVSEGVLLLLRQLDHDPLDLPVSRARG